MKIWVALMMVAVAFAGCAGDSDDETQGSVGGVDTTTEGKGAINGLLIDDRYRPLELTDDALSEYQFNGFLLLTETGTQVQTNADGEFSFTNLEPGDYTLRANVDQHEGTPQRVTVKAGEITDAEVIVRRISSESSFVLTEEYSLFIPCAVGVIINALTFGCLDSSGDSYRTGPAGLNYTKHADATYMVAEAMMTKDALFSLVVRGADGRFADADSEGGNYMKAIMENGAIYDQAMNTDPWVPGEDLEAVVFFSGTNENPVEAACPTLETLDNATGLPVACVADLGPAVGHKGRLMLSVFIGEPEVDLETYRLLTEEAS